MQLTAGWTNKDWRH